METSEERDRSSHPSSRPPEFMTKKHSLTFTKNRPCGACSAAAKIEQTLRNARAALRVRETP